MASEERTSAGDLRAGPEDVAWGDLIAAGAAVAPPAVVALAGRIAGFAGPPVERLLPGGAVDLVARVLSNRSLLLGAAIPPLAYLALARPRSRATEATLLALGALAAATPALGEALLGARPRPLRVLSREEADRALPADAPILGVLAGGEARAYPLALALQPRPIHDLVGGVPLVPTYCPSTNAALAFRDEAPGGRLELEEVGALHGNLTFYEARTKGLIQQLEARVAAGPFAGAPLETIPLVLTTWGDWRALAPRATALVGELGLRDRLLARARERGRARIEARGGPAARLARPIDRRLPATERVLGVAVRGWWKAHVRARLRERGVVEDSIHGLPIAVLFDGRRDIAMAFERRLRGRVLALRPVEADDRAREPRAVAVERESGSLFDVLGHCVGGRLVGERLAPVPLQVDKVYWYAWAMFRPETEIIG